MRVLALTLILTTAATAQQAPDGFPYILTAEDNGALMRMEPFTPKQGPLTARPL